MGVTEERERFSGFGKAWKFCRVKLHDEERVVVPTSRLLACTTPCFFYGFFSWVEFSTLRYLKRKKVSGDRAPYMGFMLESPWKHFMGLDPARFNQLTWKTLSMTAVVDSIQAVHLCSSLGLAKLFVASCYYQLVPPASLLAAALESSGSTRCNGKFRPYRC